jgi:hypothetical protein
MTRVVTGVCQNWPSKPRVAGSSPAGRASLEWRGPLHPAKLTTLRSLFAARSAPFALEPGFSTHDRLWTSRYGAIVSRKACGVDFALRCTSTLARRVEDADVHRFHVEIDPAIVAMLTVVESHSVLLLREFAHLPCIKPTGGR